MKYLSVEVWNSLIKRNFETEVEAIPGDLVFEALGVIFLVQLKDGVNNVVAQRLNQTKSSFQEVVKIFIKVMKENNIPCVRVQGNRKRYNFLLKMLPKLYKEKIGIVKSKESDDLRNIFYIRIY